MESTEANFVVNFVDFVVNKTEPLLQDLSGVGTWVLTGHDVKFLTVAYKFESCW